MVTAQERCQLSTSAVHQMPSVTLLASPSASNSVINSEDAGPPKNKQQQKVLEPS